jgi:hypothetical protein
MTMQNRKCKERSKPNLQRRWRSDELQLMLQCDTYYLLYNTVTRRTHCQAFCIVYDRKLNYCCSNQVEATNQLSETNLISII